MKREEGTRLMMSDQPPPYASLIPLSPPSYPYLMSFERPPMPPKFVQAPESTKLESRDWLLIHSILVTMLNISMPVWFQFPRPIFCQYLIVQTAYTMILFNGVIWKRIKSLEIIRYTAIGYLFLLALILLTSKWLIHYDIIKIRLPDHPFNDEFFFSSRIWWTICQTFSIVIPVALLSIVFYTQKYLVEKVIKAEKAETARVVNLQRF